MDAASPHEPARVHVVSGLDQPESVRYDPELDAFYVSSIVGFGSYRYTYASGHSGEAPLVGFAIRGRDLVLYLTPDEQEQKELLPRLGPHRMGKSCLYFKRLSDLDRSVLQRLVASSIAHLKQRFG